MTEVTFVKPPKMDGRSAAGRCSVCLHPMRVQIEGMLATHQSHRSIELKTREYGQTVKAETVKAHLMRCLGGVTPSLDLEEVTVMAGRKAPPGPAKDFATLVRDKATELMDAGLLRVTTRDGLAAQTLIDRREEKAEERTFMLNLARLLSGGGAAAPEGLTEGSYVDVTPELEGEATSMLAPAHLREPLDPR